MNQLHVNSINTMLTLEQIDMLQNKKKLQHALVFRKKHIPDISIFAQPPYDLIQKCTAWDQSPVHREILKLFILEPNAHQALEAIHPTNLLCTNQKFPSYGFSIPLFQCGLDGPTRPNGFFTCSFQEAEQNILQLSASYSVQVLQCFKADGSRDHVHWSSIVGNSKEVVCSIESLLSPL